MEPPYGSCPPADGAGWTYGPTRKQRAKGLKAGARANDGARLVDLARNPFVCGFPPDRCTHLVDPTLEEMRAAAERRRVRQWATHA